MRYGRYPGIAAVAAAGVVLLSSCAPAAAEAAGPRVTPISTVAATGFVTGLGSTAVAPPFTAPSKKLKVGARGKAVKQLQARLRELGFLPGKIDGQYGGATQYAVWAFQKVNGIKPSGTVNTRTWRALENPVLPRVLVPKGKPTRVEVNLTKQIMVLYVTGKPKVISHISSGSGIPYCETAQWQGRVQQFCGNARTPTGDYKTTWRVSGWHRSYLGQLYNPIFFNGGIALHGALSVPLAPASHGCVRLPMHIAEILPDMLGTGVPVHVRGKFRR